MPFSGVVLREVVVVVWGGNVSHSSKRGPRVAKNTREGWWWWWCTPPCWVEVL